MYTNEDFINNDVFFPQKYISYAKKKANDWKWLEKVATYYEYFNHSDADINKRHGNFKMNYDLYNGRCDMQKYVKYCNPFELQWANAGDLSSFDDIRHHPVIDTVAKAIVGEQRRRNLNSIIYNSNADGINQRRRKKLELLQGYIDQKIIGPIREEVTQAYMIENQIQDPFSLNSEQQDQMKSDITQRVQAKTPKEILEYMRTGYKTPEDRQLDKILNYLRKELDIKFVTDQAFEDFIITGLECYYVGVHNNEPTLEVCNPLGLNYYLPEGKLFLEDSEWLSYKSELSYSELLTRYTLTPKDLEKLNSLTFLGNSSGYENMKHIRDSRIISVVADTPRENINPNTIQGQREIQDLYEQFGGSMINSFTHTHTVIRSSRKIHIVKRYNPKTDSFEIKHFGEHYKRGKNDVEIYQRLIPELYEVSKVGEGSEALFLNKGPIPYQYPSLDNPYEPKMPYTGIEYSRLHKNTNNVAPMDPGKPWQFRLNVEMHRLDESLATDIGNVLLFNAAGLPANWDLDKFFTYMRNKKIAPVDFSQEGIGPFDANLFKEVNLSNSQQIQERVSFIEYIRNQIALSMSYNLSRLGLVDRYTAVSNNQQNIIQSSLQTETIYAVHNKAVENMLNSLMNAARVAWKENPKKASYILDDMSIAELELDSEMLWRSEIGVFISNESEDTENLRLTKEMMLPLIQNQMINTSQAIKLIWSKSGAQALEVAESAEEKLEAMRQAEQDFQQQMMQQQAEIQKQLQDQKAQMDIFMQEKEFDHEKFVEGVRSTTLANQYDINKNNENDLLEDNREQREEDAKLQREKIKSDEKRNKEDNQTKLKIAKMKPKPSSK
jgi:hypothetical protein